MIIQKKKLLVVASLAAFVFIGVAAHNPEQKQQGYKNLKVLPKDISRDSLKAVMNHFTRSLGVKCMFCHAPNADTTIKHPDFASDAKPEKDIARYMMKMTSELNQNYFNFNHSAQPDTIRVINCYTCHRGDAHPGNLQPPADEQHQQPQQQGQPGEQPAKQQTAEPKQR